MQRNRLLHRRFTRPGASPGEFHGGAVGEPPRIRLITYDSGDLVEREVASAEDLPSLLQSSSVNWIDVQGLGDGSLVRRLGELFDLHPLAQADVVNTGQRPKAELYDSTLFVVLREALVGSDRRIEWDQISLFLGPHWVLTFQERRGDCLGPLRERLRKSRGQLRKAGPDYLACMMIDAVVDGYFPVLEEYGDRLETIEADVLERPTREVLGDVYGVKRELMGFRRAAWPLRDVLSRLLRDEEAREEPLITAPVLPYLRDTEDHLIQVVDVIETYRELAGSFIDIYLSSIANRTNEVMRVLTVLATIFIPLTFLAGVYGMNFDTTKPGNMPELEMPYGYVIFWAICIGVAGGLLFIFRRLGWLGSR